MILVCNVIAPDRSVAMVLSFEQPGKSRICSRRIYLYCLIILLNPSAHLVPASACTILPMKIQLANACGAACA